MVASIVSYLCVYPKGAKFWLQVGSRGAFSIDEKPLTYVTGRNVSFEISVASLDATTLEDLSRGVNTYVPGESRALVTVDGNQYEAIAHSFSEQSGEYHIAFVPIEGMDPVQVVITV